MLGSCNIPNSPFNQHQLQVWFGIECFERTNEVKVKDGLLLYFDKEGKCKTELYSKWSYSSTSVRKKLCTQINKEKK